MGIDTKVDSSSNNLSSYTERLETEIGNPLKWIVVFAYQPEPEEFALLEDISMTTSGKISYSDIRVQVQDNSIQ